MWYCCGWCVYCVCWQPSTGLDPVASRLMWRLLSRIASTKRSAIVLTTHNMLECEAVCTRICIMKMGEMVCLGDSQHLRSAHGTGFLLEMSLGTPQAVDRAKQVGQVAFVAVVVVVVVVWWCVVVCGGSMWWWR